MRYFRLEYSKLREEIATPLTRLLTAAADENKVKKWWEFGTVSNGISKVTTMYFQGEGTKNYGRGLSVGPVMVGSVIVVYID